jgi:hypothetical protein
MRNWALIGLAAIVCAAPVAAQAPNAGLLAKQEAAMKALAFLDGEWRGLAQAYEPGGVLNMTQTERSGTLLGGTIRLIEGRSFDDDGKTIFNAFAVISYDVPRSRYSITSHASGYSTTAELKVRADGFSWEIPAGPGAKVEFEATVARGIWTEIGHYVGADGTRRKTFDMRVERIGATARPAGGDARPKARCKARNASRETLEQCRRAAKD